MRVISFNLPVPPSANNLFFNVGKGRAPSQAYKAWKREAAAIISAVNDQHGKPAFGRGWQVIIRAGINHQRDLDNCAKPILDALVANLDTPGDQWCDRIELTREGAPGRAYVTIIDCPAERERDGETISLADAANRVLANLKPIAEAA